MNQLLQNAAYGTAMILMVMILRRVLKDRLVPGARLALWGACLFRLLCPNPPESVLSLWGLVGRLDPTGIGTQSAPAPAVTGPVYVLEPELPVVPAAPIDPSAAPAASAARPAAFAFPWETVLAAVWLAVGIAVGLWYVMGWVRARRAVACAIPVEKGDPKYRARYRLLPRFARLREGPVEGAPLTFGALRPTVVLSPGLEGEELACVLAHEGIHAARRDNLWHYAMAAALTVHWWNPAVWLMARLLRRDIELACDRAAVKKLGEDRRADYAQALVTLSTQGSGPAFSQSFGRKATEERIRSIMKFKKPTVIGVILTLVLVLGVTIAFASDPKTPENDNKAADMSVADQAGNETADPAGEYSSDFRCSVYYDGAVVTRVVIPLSVLEEDLDIQVNRNSMFQAEAELILTQAQSIAVDGVIDWTFEEDNGLRHEELPEESTEAATVSANGYWDKDGKFVKVGFSEIVRDFILPQALMGEDTGVQYGLDGYTVVEPEIDGQGNAVVRDEDGNIVIVGIRDGVRVQVQVHYQMPGLLCTQSGCTANGVHRHDGVQYDACAATCTPEQYAAALDAWVTLDAMTQKEANGWLDIFQTCYDHVQAGDSDAFYYNIYNGTQMASAFYKSDRAAAGYPVNSKGETYGPDMPDVYGSSPDLILAMGTNGEDGYVRASELNDSGYPGGVNNPEQALAYMEWLKTQPATRYIPLYDQEGNVIGRFGVSNPEAESAPQYVPTSVSYPVCAVDGCNTVAQHTHNGVTYCGGEAHYGDTCDGSCIYNTLASTPSGSHHQESHHNSHH